MSYPNLKAATKAIAQMTGEASTPGKEHVEGKPELVDQSLFRDLSAIRYNQDETTKEDCFMSYAELSQAPAQHLPSFGGFVPRGGNALDVEITREIRRLALPTCVRALEN